MEFSTYLKGIESLYRGRTAELALSRPATAAAVDRLQRQCGFALPAELRKAFLTTDGVPQEKPFFARPGYLTSYGFLSTRLALEHRQRMRKRAPSYGGYV